MQLGSLQQNQQLQLQQQQAAAGAMAMGHALAMSQQHQSAALQEMQNSMLSGINQLGGLVSTIAHSQFATMVAGDFFSCLRIRNFALLAACMREGFMPQEAKPPSTSHLST